MGFVTWGPPQELIRLILSVENYDTFIETGTFKGETSKWASKLFLKVVSIEANKEMYGRVCIKLASQNNIEFLFGPSQEKLKTVVSALNKPAIFWLDAHYCGVGTHGETSPCPLLKEIEILNTSDFNHVILIDDARLFMAPLDLWPDIGEVIKALSCKERHIIIIDDVIVSIPYHLRSIAVKYVQEYASLPWRGYKEKIRAFFENIFKFQ